jgi:hypothetical protein
MAVRERQRSVLRLACVALVLTLLLTSAPAHAVPSWTKVASPNRGTVASLLADVAAVPGTSTAWAVGYYWDTAAGNFRTLIQRYNGSSWNNVVSPNGISSGASQLNDVDATGASNVWAVGYDGSGTLVLRYNGTSWVRIAAPSASISVRAVEAVSSTEAWAVGYSGSRAVVVQRKNGAWTTRYTIPVPDGRHLSVFEAVTVDSSGGVWAVGWDRNYDAPGRPVSTVVVHFDGTSWTREVTPNPDDRNHLMDVAVAGNGDVFAVGLAQDTSGSGIAGRGLMLRRSGGSWAALAMPPGDAQAPGQLQSVAATASGPVWAVGYYSDSGSGLHQPLLLRWTSTGGGTMSTYDVTPALTVPAFAYGVSAATSGTLWAVGHQSTTQGDRTLVLRGSP